MNQCPCCSQPLLRCIRRQGVYWFCSSCWQEMPDLLSIIDTQSKREKLERMNLIPYSSELANAAHG